MDSFFVLISNFYSQILDVLKVHLFYFDGVSITLYALLLAIFVVSLVITVFWRGGRG